MPLFNHLNVSVYHSVLLLQMGKVGGASIVNSSCVIGTPYLLMAPSFKDDHSI